MADHDAPLAAYAFRVSLGGDTAGFSEVSGLEMVRDAVHYRHGLSFLGGEALVTIPSAAHVRLTLRRGIVPGRGALFAWLNGDAEPRTLEISLIDADNRPAATWRAARAVPVKLSAPHFDAAANMVAIEAVEMLAIGLGFETTA